MTNGRNTDDGHDPIDPGLLVAPAPPVAELEAICRAARVSLDAAAVSIAAVRDDHLTFLAADGEGADAIVGFELALDRGLSGYVARSGEPLAVVGVADDERFALEVAAGTGYVPRSIVVVPVTRADGEVLGVLSVLDPAAEKDRSLTIARALSTQAGRLLAPHH